MLELIVTRPGVRTPCCDYVPAPAGDRLQLCRGCGTIYQPARDMVETVFGACDDVTPMTPRRLLRSSRPASWADDQL